MAYEEKPATINECFVELCDLDLTKHAGQKEAQRLFNRALALARTEGASSRDLEVQRLTIERDLAVVIGDLLVAEYEEDRFEEQASLRAKREQLEKEFDRVTTLLEGS
jgi:nucleotide-binding universal stress UspA family protein